MSKKLELEAFGLLETYLQERFPGCVLENHLNKGGGHSGVVGDAILRYEGKSFDIEIKASTKEPVGNVRITHQTVTKAIGKDVIVALISKLGTGTPTFEFFRLTDVVENLAIEPHFFIMKKHTKTQIRPLASILALPDGKLNIDRQLNRTVRSYMNERVHAQMPESVIPEVQAQAMLDETDKDDQEAATLATFTSSDVIQPPWASPDHFLWSPHASEVDEAGEPYPPWIKYPNMPRTSSGWRQGEGEDYSAGFYGWLNQQSVNVIETYRMKYPAPPEWANVWPPK